MTGYLESKKIKLNKISKDDYSRILIVDANIDDQNFLLINFYNANTESEQINIISRLNQLLDDCYLDSTKKVVLAGDFNLFLDASLEALAGNPTLKKKSISKAFQLIEQHNLIGIRRIRNPILKRYTFRKNHFSGFIQRRLDYIFVSNSIQENIKDTNISPLFCSDNSTLFVSYQTSNNFPLGKHFWKFNSSLTKD